MAAVTALADELVTSHLPLADFAADELRTRLPGHVERDDLVAVGRLALTRAAQEFNAERGVPFAAYALQRLRGALLDELRRVDWASRSVRATARRSSAAYERLTASLGRTPTLAEVATALGVTPREMADHAADVSRALVVSLDVPVAGAAGASVADAAPTPEELLLERERTAYVRSCVTELPDRLRHVVVRLYYEDARVVDVARELGVTEARVCQMRREGLDLMRHAVAKGIAPEAKLPSQRTATGIAARRRDAYAASVAATAVRRDADALAARRSL
jgi:RNA polymerase sigma factor FliA